METNMNIQTAKLDLIEWISTLNDSSVIEILRQLKEDYSNSKKTRKDGEVEEELKPFSEKEFNDLIDSAESDSENGRLTSARELKNEIESWN
jgi:hypothetical protein